MPHQSLLLLLFVGGFSPIYTKTTELVTTNPPTAREGPLLPDYFYDFCAVLVQDKVFLIGGHVTENKLLVIDVKTSAMTYKSELNHGRYWHACAEISGSNGEEQVVVSGGYGASKSTEIYDIDNDIWQEGNKVLNFPAIEQ